MQTSVSRSTETSPVASDSPHTPRRLLLPFFAAVAGLGFLAHLGSKRNFGPDGDFLAAWGFVIVVLTIVPAWVRWLQLRRQGIASECIPFLPILGAFYALYFGLPVLVTDELATHGRDAPVSSLRTALHYAVIGWLALLVGYYGLSPRLPCRSVRLHWSVESGKSLAMRLLFLGSLAAVVSRMATIPRAVEQVMHMLMLMGRVGLGILLLLSLRRRLSNGWNVFVWAGLLPLFLLLQVGSGFVASLAYSALFVLMLVWATGSRVPATVLVAFGIAILLLRGSLPEFRDRIWEDPEAAAMGPLAKSWLFLEVIQDRFDEDGLELIPVAHHIAASRTAHLALFADVAWTTPDLVPYWGGETYKTIPASLIPRFLWPGKPVKEVGQAFGHRYAILDPDDQTTSVNLPHLIEFYVNFGVTGVVGGMLLLGMFYGWLSRKLNTVASGDGGIVIGAVLFTTLLNIESDLSLVCGSLWQIAVALFVVFRVLGRVIRPDDGDRKPAVPDQSRPHSSALNTTSGRPGTLPT